MRAHRTRISRLVCVTLESATLEATRLGRKLPQLCDRHSVSVFSMNACSHT